MSRGPKLKTGENDSRAPAIRRDNLDPPSSLDAAAEAEYRRLVAVLESKGTLDRVDLSVLSEAARVKALLDQAHIVVDVLDPSTLRAVTVLTTQRRGLLRELGLTIRPSNVRIGNPSGTGERHSDSWDGKLKIG